MRRIPLLLAVLLLLAPWKAGARSMASAAAAGAPTVILVSLDGAPAHAARLGLGAAEELARRGAAAERMIPVFPTNTFPNHVSLVTGVHPDVHGIVNNVFVDAERGEYDKESDPTWIAVEPLWSIAESRGIVSASFHWVGSEGPWRSGRGPRYWKSFDPRTPEGEKVDQILAWLDIGPDAERPRLVTAWFRGADRAGHDHGPGGAEVRRALEDQDAALGRLVAGLDARGAFETTTLLVVSDHGMAAVERKVDLGALLRRAGLRARVRGAGGFATVTLSGGPSTRDRAVALARGHGLEAWRREAAPPELRLGNARYGDVAVVAPPGVVIGGLFTRMRGSHGHRPDEPSMAALFVAAGRGVRPGTGLGDVHAVDVAPTVLALLGAEVPDWMEGRPLASRLAGERVETRAPSEVAR
jgi:predicted AlkP superfamily pyrophosphatase or phosphodiesterase